MDHARDGFQRIKKRRRLQTRDEKRPRLQTRDGKATVFARAMDRSACKRGRWMQRERTRTMDQARVLLCGGSHVRRNAQPMDSAFLRIKNKQLLVA